MPHFIPLYYINSYIWFPSEQEIVRNNSFPPDSILSQIRLFFSKPDIEILGGSEKKTGQTVIEDCTWAAEYEKIRGDWI